MDIEQLRQMEAIARLGTMSAASQSLHMSQPALSRSIQKLEAELGFSLFERTKNKAQINAAGRLVAQRATNILVEVQSMKDALDDLAKQARTLRVGTCAPAPLWHLTARIIERFPEEMLKSELHEDRDIEQGVMDGMFDLGITRRPFMFPTVTSIPLMNENLSISVPDTHRLASASSVTFEDLAHEKILLFQEIGFWYELVYREIPHPEFVVQQDREVFKALTHVTDALFFVTDAPSLQMDIPHRVKIDISDPQAHVTYFLLVHSDASDVVQDIAQWIKKTQVI